MTTKLQAAGSGMQATSASLRLVLAYAVFAGLWILLSDKAVAWLFSDPAQIVFVGTLKGWLFVGVTSLLLYGLIRRLLAQALALSLREHEAQTENLRTQQLLAAVVDSSTDAIFAKDMEGRYVLFNRETVRVTGKAAELVLGCDDTALFPPEEARMLRANDRRVIAENQIITYEETLSTMVGERTYLATKGPLRDGDGHVIGMFGISRDITERKRLEEVHLQAQKLESLGTLAGGIAHDFNNILAAIRGNADLVAEDVGPEHVAAESLEEIRKASARASELVRRITAFGRPREPQQEVVDLGAVVGEVLKLLRSTLPAGISLRMDFAGETPHVLADAGQIHEAIVNLTTNAAYAIGRRAGTIEYRLEPVQVGEEFVRSIPGIEQGRYARLTVTDSGCGMDAATLERIFDAFYTTKAVGEGTGLGLSMVHGIMKSHGGAVTVESTPGKGSSFVLYFPVAKEKAQKEEQGAPAQIFLYAGQRVLYVDDEEALVFLASRALSRLGHQISGFTDPKEALEAFRAHPQDYDIVVTDLSMPHMSGFELAREVLAVRPGMPVLMTSGYMHAEDEDSARAAGIREVILKPATMDELGQVLDRVFRDSISRD